MIRKERKGRVKMLTIKDKAPDQSIDIRGKICPYTLIETRDSLKQLSKGQILEVLCDYEPAAENTIPNFCRKKGCPFKVEVVKGGKLWKIKIEKTD
ncbi:hypothetical protein LCGC14_1826110 [marine sediment metagenome]|uniref:UPF0033 domain-containing protein n=1 Tax=marine sediment metagenome TaxID=412755 RepID=A0A0F9JH21_9ZZZZ